MYLDWTFILLTTEKYYKKTAQNQAKKLKSVFPIHHSLPYRSAIVICAWII